MLSLRKKKKNKDEEDSLDNKEETIKKSLRKKKKKEPPKPWGKKERKLILFTILITVAVSSALAISAREWKLPGFPRINIPSLKSEPIIITKKPRLKDTTIEQEEEKAKKVLKDLEDLTKDLSGVYGLYVINLNSGFVYGEAQNEDFQAASLIKLPVMVGMYTEAEEGMLDLDEKYVLKESDKVGGSGSLYSKPAGTKLTFREIIKLMGKQSDNTAYRIALKTLGEDKVEEIISEIGMTNTSFENNQTTPFDTGLFFQKLWSGKLVNREHQEELFGFLTDTIYEDWISAGIPDDVVVAHKFGRELHVVNDAGIIFTEEPFVIVIFSKGIVESEADEVLPEITKAVYKVQVQQ